ncbi:MAG TPA: serine hydrolase domain-containing protein [Candidatus Krumholzibacteria bacterium]|nr:serine hydrolase domain-containing protein [Candidatus Krumholzibacteria bacterium]
MIRPCTMFSIALLSIPTLISFAIADPIDDIVRAAMEKRSIPGLALTIVKEGQTVKDAVYGQANVELGVAVTPQTLFPIASVTKVFTASLIMKMVEQKALSLDDVVGNSIPNLPETWKPVTVRQMLAHTSGLPDVIVNPITGEWLAQTRDETLAKAAALPMQFEPGTAWSYNQTNYILLGMILESKSGKSFETLVADSIFVPLEMKSTVFGDARTIVPGRGAWYSRIDFSGPQPRLSETPYPTWVTYPPFVHTCAGLNTSAAELARFVDAVAMGKLLTPQTVASMWQRQKLKDGTPAGMDEATGMTLGWIYEEYDGHPWIGGTGGATVAFRHDVEAKLTVVVLTNCQGADPDGLATEILQRTAEGQDPKQN